MANVERIELVPGFTVSRVLTGLWQIADMERHGRKLEPAATAAAMAEYVEAGLTTFDVADHYGSAEEIVGAFQARRPGRVEVATKWVPRPGPVTRERVRAAIERALERLRADAIDLLQFHAWSYSDPAYLDALFHLQELREEGLIRHLGLTNFDAAHLAVALHSGLRVVSNQVCYSLLDRRPRRAMSELCRRHGVRLLAYGTLGGGLLTERYRGRPEPDADELATWSEMKYKRFLDLAGGWEALQRLLEALAAIAERLGVSIANVACRWVLEQAEVAGIIIGARLGESAHVDDNLRLFDFSLDGRAREEIEAAADALALLPGDCGDEYRRPPFLTASGDLSHHFDSMPPPYEARRSADGTTRVLSGTPWEAFAGYCRALRTGDEVRVSGTTASHRERLIGGADPAAQTHFVIDKIEGALRSLGARLEDVVRTRVYVSDMAHWETVARVHGERFGAISPANTLVRAELVGAEYLVEMEADAVVRR